MDGRGRAHVGDRVGLRRIGSDPLGGDDVAKELDRGATEVALGDLHEESSFTEAVEYALEVVQVRVEILRVDDDVVDVNQAAGPGQSRENYFHVALKGDGSVRESKGHDVELHQTGVLARVRDKRGLLLVFFGDRDLVESRGEV